jgi:alpha-L-fucosidase 2
MSTELGVDRARHEKWRHILKHLSGFTTQEMGGKTVFRYTERGTKWWRNNTLGIQHIYPAGAIGLDSEPKLLEISRNTIEVMGRWVDNNGSNSFFPAAVRVGYDPKVILAKLREYVTRHCQPNGFAAHNPHGIENCSIVPNTINMMLCMGHQNVLRVFGVWPRDRDARFASIRARGAFLVSGELADGHVRYVLIRSERGRPCTLVNPWPGKAVVLYRNGKQGETPRGERLKFATAVGEEILLGPAGTVQAELRRRIATADRRRPGG